VLDLVQQAFNDKKDMRERNKIKESNTEDNKFAAQAGKLSEGLYYISETDAEVSPFAGSGADAVTREEILRQTKSAANTPVEERNFAEIFARLTRIQDWHGDEEKATAAKFNKLKEFLEKNLKDLKVFKVGTIQIKIYFVGIDSQGKLMGVQTKAVET